MPVPQASTSDHHEPVVHEIRIKGHLDERWAAELEGLAFTHESDGTTTLRGLLRDQAALHGVLNGIRDLGLTLIAVHCVIPDGSGSDR